jgi:hypothetical protein
MMDSLDLLLDTVRQERTAQLSHFDALDSKAGILLGFAAALIALSSEVTGWFRDVGVIGLGLSAIVAATAFFPRKLPVLDVGELRAYLRADLDFTKLRLHDTQLAMIQTGSSELKRKARLLKLSVLLLGAAAVTLAAGIIVGGHHG